MRRESRRSSRDSGCLFCGFLGPPKANTFGCQPACPGRVGGVVGCVRSLPLEPHGRGPCITMQHDRGPRPASCGLPWTRGPITSPLWGSVPPSEKWKQRGGETGWAFPLRLKSRDIPGCRRENQSWWGDAGVRIWCGTPEPAASLHQQPLPWRREIPQSFAQGVEVGGGPARADLPRGAEEARWG